MPRSLRSILTPLASLKLTVALFVLAMILIFAGTLAQREMGNWDVVYRYFRSPNADHPSPFIMIPLRHLLFVDVPGAIPFPGGMIIGGLLLINLLAAHAVRFRATWKRAGVLILHAGLIVLLIGEAITAWTADEGMMIIPQGSKSQFVEDLREVELAVIDPSDPQQDRVTVIPQSMLVASYGGHAITHEDLPFAVEVLDWMPNSQLLGPRQDQTQAAPNLATAGHGKMLTVAARSPATGVAGNEVNRPAAYVRLSRQGQDLGTYLVSNHFATLIMLPPRQTVTVEDKPYEIELRFRRTYKPYTIHVLETRHDKFVGTEIPRNFSSRVRVIDPAQHEDREVLIRMNQPLRYRGDTFYQSQMGQMAAGDNGAVPYTGLQVVRNPGWLLPYISCVLVSVGMLAHFGLMLGKFTARTIA